MHAHQVSDSMQQRAALPLQSEGAVLIIRCSIHEHTQNIIAIRLYYTTVSSKSIIRLS